MEVAVRWLMLACTMLMAAPMAAATTLEIIPQPHQVTFYHNETVHIRQP